MIKPKKATIIVQHDLNLNVNKITLWTCYKLGFGFILGAGLGIWLYELINKIGTFLINLMS